MCADVILYFGWLSIVARPENIKNLSGIFKKFKHFRIFQGKNAEFFFSVNVPKFKKMTGKQKTFIIVTSEQNFTFF